MILKIVSTEGYRTGLTASSVSHVAKLASDRAVLYVRPISYVSNNVAICSLVIFPTTLEADTAQEEIYFLII